MPRPRPPALACWLLLPILLLSAPLGAQTESADEPTAQGSAQASAQASAEADTAPATSELLRIEISGLEGETLTNARSVLGLQREVKLLQAEPDADAAETTEVDAVSEERLRRLFDDGYAEILTALQPFGYYRARVEGELTREGPTWVARYRVTLGERMPLAEVDLQILGEGERDPAFRRLTQQLPLKAGDPLSHTAYETAKNRLLGRAAERGYLEAEFRANELRIDLQNYQATAYLRFDTGPRFQLGEVTFFQYESEPPLPTPAEASEASTSDATSARFRDPTERPQTEILRPEVLRRLVPFQPGDPYDTELLIRLERDLSSTAYFDNVAIVPRLEEIEDRRVPIEVRLTAGRKSVYSGGIGYGTDTGGRLTFDLDYRRLNRLGHHGDLRARVSEVEQSIGLRYIVPLSLARPARSEDDEDGDSLDDETERALVAPRRHTLTYSAGYFDLKPDTSDSRTARIGAALSRSRGHWQEVLSLDFERTDFEVGLDSGRTDLLIPGISWTWVESDDRLFSRRGWRLQLQVRGADDALLSTASFLRLYGEGKYILPLGDRFRLLLRGEGGTLLISDFRQLPPAHRFFTGGDGSIRGFGYRELGDRDEEGNLIGGRNLAVLSAELEARIWREFGAAVFYDAGNALDRPFESPERGAGFGLRYFSPVGPFRLDVAWALTRDDTPIRLHLGFGIDL